MPHFPLAELVAVSNRFFKPSLIAAVPTAITATVCFAEIV